MIRFIKPLTALLMMSFSTTSVRGQNGCITGVTSRCSPTTTSLDLENCGVTDNDMNDLKACFESIGRHRITHLLMEDNRLARIPAGLFADFTMMVELDLRNNNILTIAAGAFDNLPVLEGLFLADNELETVPANVFAGLTVLDRLSLAANEIMSIEDGVFTDLIALKELSLEGNELLILQTDVFAGLVALEGMNLDGNMITTIEANVFADMPGLADLRMKANMIANIDADAFAGLFALDILDLEGNMIESLDPNIFADLSAIQTIRLDNNKLKTLAAGLFAGLGTLQILHLNVNELGALPDGIFDDLVLLQSLFIDSNLLTTVPSNIFDKLESLERLTLNGNLLDRLPTDAFAGLPVLAELDLNDNFLTTLPAGLFEDVGSGTSLTELNLIGNAGLQCIPTVFPNTPALPGTNGFCGCLPVAAVSCGAGLKCASGAIGYTCVVAVDCTDDMDCDTDNGQVCCPLTGVCEVQVEGAAGACGDPHMTGFRGQKFDFTGKENGWYAVVSDLPHLHVNMRVTSPVPSIPEITYITGLSIVTKDADGFDHSIVVSVTDPHNLESSCPVGMPPCLADGALHVAVNGDEVLMSPGEVTVAPGVEVAAVNLPGACRSFGFEKYWEQKKLEGRSQSSQMLISTTTTQDMSHWIISDPSATNKVECEAYVASATAAGGVGLFAKQSEHASFRIVTPTATIRLSHGRLHQLPMRDPTDQFDLPDHLTWQMNMAIDSSNIGLHATGILGETLVPTVDFTGAPIMNGMDAIRGQQEDYLVDGPLGLAFRQSEHHE